MYKLEHQFQAAELVKTLRKGFEDHKDDLEVEMVISKSELLSILSCDLQVHDFHLVGDDTNIILKLRRHA